MTERTEPTGADVWRRVYLRWINSPEHREYERAKRARKEERRLVKRAWEARMAELGLNPAVEDDDPYGAVYFAVEHDLMNQPPQKDQ